MLNKIEENLLISSNLLLFGSGMLGPLLAVFTKNIGGGILDISWAWAIYLAMSGIATIIVGRISDEKISKAKIMVLGYTLNAIFTFSYLFVSNPIGLFLVQAGLGLAFALAAPTWDALYAKYEDRRHAGFVWGLARGSGDIMTGAAILIGGIIVSYFSFFALFIAMGIVQTIAAIYQARILKMQTS